MRALAQGQRVKVISACRNSGDDEITINAYGTVTRVRSDGGAWIALDERNEAPIHPFDAEDNRGTHVLAYPDMCEPDTKKANRAERKKNAKIAQQPTKTCIDKFGKDHWSTFAYVSTTLPEGGFPVRAKMRCDPNRHPLLAHLPGPTSPTRLKGTEVLQNHDDWDCLDDCEQEGLLHNIGTDVSPVFRFTDKGLEVMKQLTKYKQDGGNFATFTPTFE